MWPERHADLATAIRTGDGVVSGIPEDDAFDASTRLAVYRNNMIVNTRAHLAAVFPVVGALLGEDCFNEIARQFILSKPPRSPVMLVYGDGFPAYLSASRLFETVPYIADIAALEWARYRAYHAADAEPIELAALATVAADDIENISLTLHPSVSVISSAWPIVSIWQAHQRPDPTETLASLGCAPETALVARPALDVEVRAIADGPRSLIEALRSGQRLGVALEVAGQNRREDLSACLAGAFECGAIAAATLTPDC